MRLWTFLQLVSLCSGARPSEETHTSSAGTRGVSLIASGHLLSHNASSAEKALRPATHFKGFDGYYDAQNGLKDASKPLLQHAQDLGHRAVGTYDSMKQLSGVIKKTNPVLNAIEEKADETRLQVDEESHEVVEKSLNALGALRKYEANRGSINDYYDAGKLSEKTLLLEGKRHAESGKLDLFANDGFPSRYPQVKLDDLDTPQKHHLFNKLRNDVIAQPAAHQHLKGDDLAGQGLVEDEDKAVQAHRPLSQSLDGQESTVGDGSDASAVERELLPGEK